MKLTITCKCGKTTDDIQYKAGEFSHGEYLNLDCKFCNEKTSMELHVVNVIDIKKVVDNNCAGKAYCKLMPYGDKCKICK